MNENELVALAKLKLLIEKNNNHRNTKKYAEKYARLLEIIALAPTAIANSYKKATDKMTSSPPASLTSSVEDSDSSEKSSSSEEDSELPISTSKNDAINRQDLQLWRLK